MPAGRSHSRPGSVRLRAVVAADLPRLFVQQDDPVASEMAAFPVRTEAAFHAHWAGILANPTVIARAIEHDGELAGHIGCFEQGGRWFVGYWLGRSFWNRGIATRALGLLLAEVRQRPLVALVAVHNVASRRVLEKWGFVCTLAHAGEFEFTLAE